MDLLVVRALIKNFNPQAARVLRKRDLRKLHKNTKLGGVLGGVESVTMGDAMAREEASRKTAPTDQGGNVSKIETQRCGERTFDIVIEIRRGAHYEWRCTQNVAQAVAAILDGKRYKTQQRTLESETQEIVLKLIDE